MRELVAACQLPAAGSSSQALLASSHDKDGASREVDMIQAHSVCGTNTSVDTCRSWPLRRCGACSTTIKRCEMRGPVDASVLHVCFAPRRSLRWVPSRTCSWAPLPRIPRAGRPRRNRPLPQARSRLESPKWRETFVLCCVFVERTCRMMLRGQAFVTAQGRQTEATEASSICITCGSLLCSRIQ